MVLPDSHRVPRVPWYLGRDPREPIRFRLRGRYPLWRSFPEPSANESVCNSPTPARGGPDRSRDTGPATLARLAHDRFRLFPFRSPLLGESRLLSFPGGTEMVHFPPFASSLLWIRRGMTGHDSRRVSPFGHPRVEARSSSPGLIAAYDALHRLPAPRHPPYALSSLTIERTNACSASVLHHAVCLTIRFSKSAGSGFAPRPDLLANVSPGIPSSPAPPAWWR